MAHRAGVSDSAKKAEKPIDTTMAAENCWYMMPTEPGKNAIGTNTAIKTSVMPITAPVLLMLVIDPIWLGVLVGVNLQTSFLTPPFGFALFYLRGVAPADLPTSAIYKGILPFVMLQVVAIAILFAFPQIVTWLPKVIAG